MDYISYGQLPDFLKGAAELFAEKKDELCEMDAAMGDGDLGLTMQKGFGALPALLAENGEPGSIGKTLVRAGMKMAGLVPSTMGTLMASGIMEGGKAVGDTEQLGAAELAAFLQGFAAGIQKRGKCSPGDRTILDAAAPAAASAQAAHAAGQDVRQVLHAAVLGAQDGVEATRQMLPKFGKAAVFQAKAIGTPDQGAVAFLYFLQGLERFFA